jgi:ABC-type branched-subunit amino acid transport system ATPase component
MLLGTRRHRTNTAHHSQHLFAGKQQRLAALAERLEMAALDELVDGLSAAVTEELGDFAGREQ